MAWDQITKWIQITNLIFTFPLQEVLPFTKLFFSGLLKKVLSRKFCFTIGSVNVKSSETRQTKIAMD
jgi:hypothetical protein